MDKLTEDYLQIKSKISENFDQLKDTLDAPQFSEIQDSLTNKYRQAAQKTKMDRNTVPQRRTVPYRQAPQRRQKLLATKL
jgi:hypothetical protein